MSSSTSPRALREPHDRRRDLILWAGLLTGPLVWLTLLQTNYVLSYVACERRQTWFLQLAILLSVIVVAAAGFLAWRSAPRSLIHADEPSETRASWMALAGVAMSAWFALTILAMEIPVLIV